MAESCPPKDRVMNKLSKEQVRDRKQEKLEQDREKCLRYGWVPPSSQKKYRLTRDQQKNCSSVVKNHTAASFYLVLSGESFECKL